MELDFDALLRTFLAESEERLWAAEEAFLRLENDPHDEEALGEVFRAVHTIKGDAASLALSELATFSNGMEDLIDVVRKGDIVLDRNLVSLLLEGVDAQRAMLADAEIGVDEPKASRTELLQRLSEAVERKNRRRKGSSAGGKDEEGTGPGTLAGGLGDLQATTLRVDIEKLDQVLTLTGEIAVASGRLTQMLEADASREELLGEQTQADRLHMELQELVMGLRMVPVEATFRRHRRTVRDLSQSQGKQARLVIEAGGVELDNSVLQLLRDPLMHMVRNAVDHGIELPEERLAKGKSPVGQITLRAKHSAGTVIIELEDDGAGLDRDRILSQARQQGLLGETETPDDRDLYQLLFEPGFSTAEEVTEISGRGVGMDVVKRNIEALRGTVEIYGEVDAGAKVSIRLPLTLAIIEGLLIRVADETYIVPLDSVAESLDLPPQSASDDGRGVLQVRGRSIPYVRLRELFGIEGVPAGRENVVSVYLGSTEAGLVVDEVLGKSQAVIKPLSKVFRKLPGITGSAILGNGRVALILDVAELLQREIDRPPSQAAVGS